MSKFKDKQGKWLTQALFLEMGYKPQAIFTLDDEDKEYNNKLYPSLKKLYLESDDPTEYKVSQHLGGWNHWKRLRGNKGVSLAIQIATEGAHSKLLSG